MPAAQIFISYRRDDAAGYARAVCDELARHFGAERVFMDVDDIGAGLAFDDAIRQAVGESRVLLVMIGKRWRGEREGAPPRIGEPGDFVRLEVAAALAGGLRVIPLLIDGATMPTEAELPDELRPLARRHALAIDHARFATDIERLIAALRDALGEPAAPSRPVPKPKPSLTLIATATATPTPIPTTPTTATPASSPPPKTPWLAGGVGVMLAAVALATLWQQRSASRGDGPSALPASAATLVPGAASTAPAATRAAINGRWQAEVVYDWPNARYVERFGFDGEAGELHGSASFLGVPRGLLEGSVEPGGLRFVTRTSEIAGSAGAAVSQTLHRYRGRLVGDELRFVMQTEGGISSHRPVEFVARRVGQENSPVSTPAGR